jgi:maltose-binding protein MalE
VTRRRQLARVAALAGPALLAAGCGGQEGAGGATTTQRPARISVTIPTAPPEQTQSWARNSQRLRERYPTIDVVDMADMNGEKVLAHFAADSAPDVLNLVQANGPGNTEDLATRGVLLKLDDRARRDKALQWDDIWPAARNAGLYQNALVALPGGNGITAALMFYNSQLFGAAGRPTPDRLFQQGQWSWERVVAEAPLLTKRGEDGSLIQAGLGYPWFVDVWNTLLLRSYGADFLNKEGTRVTINTAAGIKALQVAYELAPRRKTMPLRGEGSSNELVRNGKIAQAVYWMAAASWWRTTPFEWDVAPTPAGPSGQLTAAKVGQMVIARTSKEPDAAWLYTSLALSPEVEVANAVERGNVALRQSNLPAWRKGMGTQRPHNLELVERTARAITIDGLRTATPQLVQVEQLFLREMQALFYDGKLPERVVDTLAAEGNALLGTK